MEKNVKYFGVKYFGASLILIALIFSASFYSYNVGLQVGQLEHPLLKGYVTIDVVRDGVLIFHEEGPNTITTIGFDYVQDMIGDNSSTIVNRACWIGASNSSSSPAVSWTFLPGQFNNTASQGNGLGRAKGTYTRTSATEWTLSKQFTASEAIASVQLAGLFWDASAHDNCLLCAKSFTAVTLAANDQITITWTLSLSQG